MKKVITLVMLLFATASAYSQAKQDAGQGIYKTSKDYEKGILTPVEKIKLNHLSSKNYIEVTTNGQKVRYYKDSIFGYRDEQKRDFRFFKNNDDEYQILANNGIVLYVTYTPEKNAKGLTLNMIPSYYFSKDLNSPMASLTVQNLKLAYSTNTSFIAMLDANFSDNASLATNDHGIYRINAIYAQSINQSK